MALMPVDHEAIAAFVSEELGLRRRLGEAEVAALESGASARLPDAYLLARERVLMHPDVGPPPAVAAERLIELVTRERARGAVCTVSAFLDSGLTAVFGCTVVAVAAEDLGLDRYLSFVALGDRRPRGSGVEVPARWIARHRFFGDARRRALALRAGVLLAGEHGVDGGRRVGV